MTVKKLLAAVDCCTRKSSSWESTCGKCPFRNREKDINHLNFNFDISCIDKLILALAEYLPKEDEE